MTRLDTPLIANKATKQLSALGYKQVNRIILKACEANKTNRYSKEAKPIVEQVTRLVHSLIFDHNYTKEQLSYFQKSIKVNNGVLQLPSMTTI